MSHGGFNKFNNSYFRVLSYFLNPHYNLKGSCVEEPSRQDITVDD